MTFEEAVEEYDRAGEIVRRAERCRTALDWVALCDWYAVERSGWTEADVSGRALARHVAQQAVQWPVACAVSAFVLAAKLSAIGARV